MQKKALSTLLLVIALFSIGTIGYAQFQAPQPFYKSGSNWLMNVTTEHLGSSGARIAKIWATDVDVTTITIGGAAAGALDMGGYSISNAGTTTGRAFVATSTTATSTFAGALGVFNQLAFGYFTGSSTIASTLTGALGIGTTSPGALLAIKGTTSDIPFLISSTTATLASSTLFMVDRAGSLHLGGGTPVLSSCGTAPSLGANSTDQAGTMTFGASAGGCTLTFSAAKASVPHCLVSTQAVSLVNAYTVAVTATTLTITQAASGGVLFDYFCPLGH